MLIDSLFMNHCYLDRIISITLRGDRRDRMVVGFTTTCEIGAYHTAKVVSSNPFISIQHYVINFVSDLRQVDGFPLGSPVSSINKTDCHEITEKLLKVALSTIDLNQT